MGFARRKSQLNPVFTEVLECQVSESFGSPDGAFEDLPDLLLHGDAVLSGPNPEPFIEVTINSSNT